MPETKIEITETEEQLIRAIRELRPFQELVITKDKSGAPDSYYLKDARTYIVRTGLMKMFKVAKKN